ncbi:hypothetical protein RUND412_007929 [Rhizina undulata]
MTTSRFKWIPRKLTLHRNERPLPKPQVPEVKVRVKMEFEMEEFLDMQALSEHEMATDEEPDRILDSIKDQYFDTAAAGGLSNTQSPHPKSEAETPHQPPLESPALPSRGQAVPTTSEEFQAPSDPMDSNPSAPAVSSGNFEDLEEDMEMSDLRESTTEEQPAFEDVLKNGVELGEENNVLGSRPTSSEHQRSPEQEQDETSVNVSELTSFHRPGRAPKVCKLRKQHPPPPQAYHDLQARIQECTEALNESAMLRENAQRMAAKVAAKVERLEAALRAKARDLEELDRQLELRDAKLSEANERWLILNQTLQQERELLVVREIEIRERQRECREKEISLESREFKLRKEEKALWAQEAFSDSRTAEKPPAAHSQTVEVPYKYKLERDPEPSRKKRTLDHQDAQVTAYCEEAKSNSCCIVFRLTRGKNTADRFCKYLEDLEMNIEQLHCQSNSSVEIYFVTAHAAMTFMRQRAYINDRAITTTDTPPSASISKTASSPQRASRVLIVGNLSPDTTKAQLRSDFFLDKSLLKTDIEKWDGVTVGRLHYASISDAVGVKMNLENSQNTSRNSIRTYGICRVRFGQGPGDFY